MHDIEYRNLTLRFGASGSNNEPLTVFENLNLEISAGSFTCLLGPSGCGKSTLLNLINGLLKPTSAEGLLVSGEDIRENPNLTRQMSYVFQGPRLLPWKTLRQNVEFGLKGMGKQPRKDWEELILKYFKLTGLEAYLDHYPHQVSGGMQQRAAIVRAWVNEPEILLMDEPFSALDEITAGELRRGLIDLWRREERRRTVLFVTHNISEAALMASDVVVLTPVVSEICYRREIDLEWPRDPTAPEVMEVERDLRRAFTDLAGVQL